MIDWAALLMRPAACRARHGGEMRGHSGVICAPPLYLKGRQERVDKSVKITAAGAAQKFPPEELSAQQGKD